MSSIYTFRTPKVPVFLGTGLLLATALLAADPAGVPNFHQVNGQLFRGGQPTNEGFLNLQKLGVKTVIDLREADSLAWQEKKFVEGAGMRFVNIPMKGMHKPSPEQISRALALLNDSTAGPVFVHCHQGVDRTGTVVACYRISHDHWDNRRALQEARALGMGWMQKAMHHYILNYRPTEAAAAGAPSTAPALTVAPEL